MTLPRDYPQGGNGPCVKLLDFGWRGESPRAASLDSFVIEHSKTAVSRVPKHRTMR